MNKDELFKDIWNSYPHDSHTPYKQWVKQGFDWMYGWHESELAALKIDYKELEKQNKELIQDALMLALEIKIMVSYVTGKHCTCFDDVVCTVCDCDSEMQIQIIRMADEWKEKYK